MSGHALRPDLPELPNRFKARPVDRRGFPVPWFLCDQDREAEANGGVWDFRVVHAARMAYAMRNDRCWLCGQPLGTTRVFVIGPMCAINRATAEPACHPDCACFSARSCPFLSNPRATRREAGMPADTAVAGIMIERNPGAVITWPTKRWSSTPRRSGAGILYELGEPTHELKAYAYGRQATSDELLASIVSGLPLLFDAAEQQAKMERRRANWANGYLMQDLSRALDTFRRYLPGYGAIEQPLAKAAVDQLTARASKSNEQVSAS